MGSTYTTNGGIEKIGLGEQAGAWGTTTNNNFDIIDRLINGVGSISLSSSGNAHDLVTSDGSLSDGMFRVITFTNATEACTITIKDESSEKLYFIRNNSGQTLTFRQGTGGTVVNNRAVAIADGKGAIIFADGGSGSAIVTDLTALFVNSQAIDNAVIGGTTPAAITGTTITATQSILPDTSGGADIGSTSAEFGDIYLADNKKIHFGTDQDANIEFDEDGTGNFLISGGDINIDATADITLDAGGEQIIFKDGSTNVGHIDLTSDNFTLKSLESDKDFIVKGNDGGSEITAMTLDMSEAGNATFNGTVTTTGLVLGSTAVTASADELNHTDGVTSNIQTQLNSKHSAVGRGLEESSASTVRMKNNLFQKSVAIKGFGSVNANTHETFSNTYSVSVLARADNFGTPIWTIKYGTGLLDVSSIQCSVFSMVVPAGVTLKCTSAYSYITAELRPNES